MASGAALTSVWRASCAAVLAVDPTPRHFFDTGATRISPCGRAPPRAPRDPRNAETPDEHGGFAVPPRGFELRVPWLYEATFRSGKRNACRWTPLDSARLRRVFSPNFHPPVTAQPVAIGDRVRASGRRATSPSSVLAVVGARADGALADRPRQERGQGWRALLLRLGEAGATERRATLALRCRGSRERESPSATPPERRAAFARASRCLHAALESFVDGRGHSLPPSR